MMAAPCRLAACPSAMAAVLVIALIRIPIRCLYQKPILLIKAVIFQHADWAPKGLCRADLPPASPVKLCPGQQPAPRHKPLKQHAAGARQLPTKLQRRPATTLAAAMARRW